MVLLTMLLLRTQRLLNPTITLKPTLNCTQRKKVRMLDWRMTTRKKDVSQAEPYG